MKYEQIPIKIAIKTILFTFKQAAKAEFSNAVVQTMTLSAPIQQEIPKTSTSKEDIGSDVCLLVPLRTASEATTSEEEVNLRCPDCRFVSRTAFALKMHRHEKHSVTHLRFLLLMQEIN